MRAIAAGAHLASAHPYSAQPGDMDYPNNLEYSQVKIQVTWMGTDDAKGNRSRTHLKRTPSTCMHCLIV